METYLVIYTAMTMFGESTEAIASVKLAVSDRPESNSPLDWNLDPDDTVLAVLRVEDLDLNELTLYVEGDRVDLESLIIDRNAQNRDGSN